MTIQFNTLSHDHLRHYAPSIFTDSGSQSTSDKYQHISTIQVVDRLAEEGFFPVKAMQCRTRKIENKLFTKHMLRFRHQDARPNEQGLFQELVLVNSHNGLSSYRLMAGIYRMVCSNGLIAGNTYEEVRVRHQGDIIGQIIEGTYSVMNSSTKMIESARNMNLIELNPDEKRIFAESVHELRFGDDDTETKDIIKPDAFLKARRYQEADKKDLFTIFNIAQENAIKGGLRAWGRDSKGHAKLKTVREVKSIDQSNSLNRALWTLAEKMAQLKTGSGA